VAKVEARLKALETEANKLKSSIDAAKAKSSTSRIHAGLRGDLWTSKQTSLMDATRAADLIATAFLQADLDAQREFVRALIKITVNPGRTPALLSNVSTPFTRSQSRRSRSRNRPRHARTDPTWLLQRRMTPSIRLSLKLLPQRRIRVHSWQTPTSIGRA